MKLFIILILFLISSTSFAANFYVLQNGSGDCSTWTAACDDIGDVSGEGIGDTIYYGAGTYTDTYAFPASSMTIKRATVADHGTETGWSAGYDGNVIINPSSSPAFSISGRSSITIDGDPDGRDRTTFDIDGNSIRSEGIDIASSSSVTINSVSIHHFTNFGIDTTSVTAPLTIDNIELHHNGHGSAEASHCGMYMGGATGSDWTTNSIVIKNSYIHSADYNNSGLATDIVCLDGGGYFKIHDNYFSETQSMTDSSDTISVRTSNVRIYNNVFYRGANSNQLIFISGSNGTRENIYIYNNLFYKASSDSSLEECFNITDGKTPGTEPFFGSGDETGGPIKNVYIYNNTFTGHFDYAIQGSSDWQNASTCGSGDNEACCENVNFYNNIINVSGNDYQGPLSMYLRTSQASCFNIDNNFYNYSGSTKVFRNVSSEYTMAEMNSTFSFEDNGHQNTNSNFDASTPSFSSYVWTLGLMLTIDSTDLVGGVAEANELESIFTTDHFGTARGVVWDIGAHEYESAALPAKPQNVTISNAVLVPGGE